MCRKAREEGLAVGAALVERNAARERCSALTLENARMRQALERIRDQSEDNLIAAIADDVLDPKCAEESGK